MFSAVGTCAGLDMLRGSSVGRQSSVLTNMHLVGQYELHIYLFLAPTAPTLNVTDAHRLPRVPGQDDCPNTVTGPLN